MAPCNLEPGTPIAAEYNVLRSAVGWRTIDGDVCDRALRASLFCVCARAAGRLIGMGRIVGDGGIYFYLQDVMVAPEWQGRGVGRRILDALLEFLAAQAPPGAFIGLMAARGAAEFYERRGFARRPDDGPGMFVPRGGDGPPSTRGAPSPEKPLPP